MYRSVRIPCMRIFFNASHSPGHTGDFIFLHCHQIRNMQWTSPESEYAAQIYYEEETEMTLLKETIERIQPLDKDTQNEAKNYIDGLIKPIGSLGKLETIEPLRSRESPGK